MNRIGVRDLMDKHRYRATHLQEKLIEKNIPGKWEGRTGLQNVYNMVNATVVPKDAYAFIFMAEIFGEPLKEILLRYTVKDSEQNSNVDKINW